MDALASGRPHMLEVATTSVSITIRDTKCVRASLAAWLCASSALSMLTVLTHCRGVSPRPPGGCRPQPAS